MLINNFVKEIIYITDLFWNYHYFISLTMFKIEMVNLKRFKLMYFKIIDLKLLKNFYNKYKFQ